MRYDVTFALVWADEDAALNRNEAYALASCRDCRTVAVAFQVVLLVGSVDVVVPQNLAAAVNYACVECVTYALATQLVVTLPGPAQRGRRTGRWPRSGRSWQEFGEQIEDVPLPSSGTGSPSSRQRILDVVRADARGRRGAESARRRADRRPTRRRGRRGRRTRGRRTAAPTGRPVPRRRRPAGPTTSHRRRATTSSSAGRAVDGAGRDEPAPAGTSAGPEPSTATG